MSERYLGLELGFESEVEIMIFSIFLLLINPLNQPMVGWSISQGWLMRLLSTNQLPDAQSHQFINQLAKFGLAVAGPGYASTNLYSITVDCVCIRRLRFLAGDIARACITLHDGQPQSNEFWVR